MNVQMLKAKKRRLLFRANGKYLQGIFDPKNISDCGKFGSFGDYFGDEIHGWYNLNEVANSVVSILQEFD